jgi:hypothetical protein
MRCANDLVLLAKVEAACHSMIEWLIGIGTLRAVDKNVSENEVMRISSSLPAVQIVTKTISTRMWYISTASLPWQQETQDAQGH